MAKDILSEFGNDSSQPQRPRAASGGCTEAKDVMDYQSPTGPKYITRTGPGLRGGTNFGNAGSQGKRNIYAEGSGSPGLHGCILNDGLDQDDGGREI
jgi:hypothetical protein